jgi:hypothetical protein
MPLDARKAQHLLQAVARSFANRQRTIVVVYLAGGSYSFAALSVIMRSQQIIDPQVLDAAGQALPRNANVEDLKAGECEQAIDRHITLMVRLFQVRQQYAKGAREEDAQHILDASLQPDAEESV